MCEDIQAVEETIRSGESPQDKRADVNTSQLKNKGLFRAASNRENDCVSDASARLETTKCVRLKILLIASMKLTKNSILYSVD
jgi:hypothetical protein